MKKTMETIITTETTMPLEELLEALNSEKDVDKAVVCRAKLEQSVKAHNQETMDAAVAMYLKQAETDMDSLFRAFVEDPYVPILRIKTNKDGRFELADGDKQLSFNTLERAYAKHTGSADESASIKTGKTLARDKKYEAYLSYFVDNLGRNLAGDMSATGLAVKAPVLTGDKAAEERKEYDFGKSSIGGLEFQLNSIVNTILPESMPVTMRRIDVKAILMACIKADNRLNFRLSNEQRILDMIFIAVRKAMTGETYKLGSKAKAHKPIRQNLTANESGSEKQEAAMSRVPERAEAVPMGKKSA